MAARAVGLRLQILMALAGLMAVAFPPLYFAIARLTEINVRAARSDEALALARSIAVHVADAERQGEPVEVALGRHAGDPTLGGATIEPLGGPGPRGESVDLDPAGGAYVARVPIPGGPPRMLTARVRDRPTAGAPSLARLVALYMVLFAGALLTFASFAMTRLIVRPVERLVRATERVAAGARVLEPPGAGARELAELGESLRAMTARLVAEETALRAKVDELTRATEQLTATQAQLVRSERLASVGRLAAGLAHEVGNPIAAMLGMQHLLLDDDLPASERKDFVVRMARETERIHLIVRDLLDFARPENTSEPAASMPAPADVAEVVSDVLALVRPQKDFKGLRVEADVAPGLTVPLAASRLTQVLLNIVLNAGAALRGRHEASVVVRGRRDEAGRVRVEVEDDGPGIPEEMRELVFEPFVTTKEVGEGTGLGLAVCRGIVESAGGTIAVDGTHAPGARVVVVLPSA